MADPDFTEITIRNPDTLEERTIAKHALAFHPGFERVDSQGRKVATPATPATGNTPKES